MDNNRPTGKPENGQTGQLKTVMRFSLIQSSHTRIVVVSIMIFIVLGAFYLGSWFFISRLKSTLDE
jgi:hypothetical protein